jgi:hypothetical protein
MTTTLSEYDEEDDEETINKTFAGKYDICNNTSDEDLLDEGLDETHKDLVDKWRKSSFLIEHQEKIIKERSSKKRRY